MIQTVKVGYKIPEGDQVDIPFSHLIVCGVSQLSGKTTTIESLLSRSTRKSIVFKTKIGEKSFVNGHNIPPFFRDRSDYEFVKSLIEAYSKEKIFIEKGTLMDLTKGAKSLKEIKESIDNTLTNAKMRAMEKEIYTRLQHYLGNLIPQIESAKLSKTLSLETGVNIMNLERFSEEVQSLVIQSVLDEVLKNHHDTIVVIPEAWKFIPQRYNNPCKRSVESFIRQGATNGNYIWMDSQELSSVDKAPLKQVSTFLLGYQSERNEVKHTLDQIPLPAKSKPLADQIMTLKKGQFFLVTNTGVTLVYVQPFWLDDTAAKEIAGGGTDAGGFMVIDDVGCRSFKDVKKLSEKIDMNKCPTCRNASISTFSVPKGVISPVFTEIPLKEPDVKTYFDLQITSLRAELLERIEKLESKIANPSQQICVVSPLEKLKKTFQEEAKRFVLERVEKLDSDQKILLLFIESQEKGCGLKIIIDKCFHLSPTSGGNQKRFSDKVKHLDSQQIIRRDKNNIIYPNLMNFIKSYCEIHGSTEQEIREVYNHIMTELAGGRP